MINGDPKVTQQGAQPPSIQNVYTDDIDRKPKKTSKFKSILGGIAGGALNMVAPGLGSIIGGSISGSGSAFGSMGDLYEQKIQFEKMQRYNSAANMLQQQQNQAMNKQQQKHSYQMIELQNRVSMQAQEFSTVSNLLKSRHDSEMTAVNNIKS